MKHTAKPLGIFTPSISAELLTIAACTHVHRTERASMVNLNSCDCDPGFQERSTERRCVEMLTIVVVLVAKDTQLPWPEAALPCMRRVMVVPCLRRPASRCRGSWRPPAFSTELFGKPELAAGGNCSGLDKLQLAWPEAAFPRCAAGHGRSVLAWHTRAKGYSGQAVKPDVCRCAEIEKKHMSSTTVSTKSVFDLMQEAWMCSLVLSTGKERSNRKMRGTSCKGAERQLKKLSKQRRETEVEEDWS